LSALKPMAGFSSPSSFLSEGEPIAPAISGPKRAEGIAILWLGAGGASAAISFSKRLSEIDRLIVMSLLMFASFVCLMLVM